MLCAVPFGRVANLVLDVCFAGVGCDVTLRPGFPPAQAPSPSEGQYKIKVGGSPMTWHVGCVRARGFAKHVMELKGGAVIIRVEDTVT